MQVLSAFSKNVTFLKTSLSNFGVHIRIEASYKTKISRLTGIYVSFNSSTDDIYIQQFDNKAILVKRFI